jgi:hypothetical protein
MRMHPSFAEVITTALQGKTIDEVKMDVSDHGVIHELVLVVGSTQIYFMPVEGKLAVEFTYARRERS